MSNCSKISEPKRLYFDIETSLAIFCAWGCGKQYVGVKQMLKDRKILCIGYAINDGPVKVLKMDMSKHRLNKFDDDADKEMLVKFMKIYETCDVAIAHNGRRFDRSRIRARLAKYGLPDIAPIVFDDSYSMCKDIDFTSHKLDYLGKYFNVGRKIDIAYDAWINVLRGSPSALNEMAHYMKGDVELLRKVYKKLKPYAKSGLNLATYYGRGDICPHCGSESIQLNGKAYTKTGQYQRYRCASCKRFFKDGKNLIKNSSNLMR